MYSTRREALAYTGFVSAARPAPSALRELLSTTESGELIVAESPGGIATFFYANASLRRCFVWSSHAGVESAFHTKGPDCTAISNRPLLSHLVGTQRDAPSFSLEWARRMLLGGSTLWNDTPFAGTFQPPPRSLVVLDGDQIRYAPHPIPLERQRYTERDPAGLEALNTAALEAVSVLRRWPAGELELSGGKDSRYAAALLRRAGIEAEHVTYARGDAGEGRAAAAVALALGVDHRIDPGLAATGAELLPTVLANLRRTDGLISEARQLPYRMGGHAGRPLIQGQAHHPRGGFPTSARNTLAAMKELLIRKNIGDQELVAPELVQERRDRLLELLAGYQVKQHPTELAYWMYSDWRMARWTIASYRSRARSRPVVWPMMDERVLRVISELSTFDRLSEVAFYAALCRLSPSLAAVPLYEDTWKFDQGPIGPAEFPDGYESRRQPFKETGGVITSERRVVTVRPLFRMATREMRCSEDLRAFIDPAALELLSCNPEPWLALGLPRVQVIQFMWKAVAIALVLDGEWLRASEPTDSNRSMVGP